MADLVTARHRQPGRGPVEAAAGPPLDGGAGSGQPVRDRGHSTSRPGGGGPPGVDEALGGGVEIELGSSGGSPSRPGGVGGRLGGAMLGRNHTPAPPHLDGPSHIVEPLQPVLHPHHHGPGRGRRRRARGVGRLIGHAAVDLVAYPGEHGTFASRHGPSHQLVVEGGQVGAAAAPSGQHHHINVGAGRRFDRSCDGRRSVGALHRGVYLDHTEGEAAAGEHPQHVGVGRAVQRGDHPHPQRHRRQGHSGVAAQGSVSREDPQQSLAVGNHRPERVGRVDGDHSQLELSPPRVEVEHPLDAHAHSVIHADGVAVAPDRLVDPLPVVAEQHHVQRGHRRGARLGPLGALDQVEVDVAAAGPGDAVDLSGHPHPGWEGLVQPPAEHLGQLADCQGLLRAEGPAHGTACLARSALMGVVMARPARRGLR